MILHLFPAEKFTTDYINRIHSLFDHTNHVFIVYGKIKPEYKLNEIKYREEIIFTDKLILLGNKIKMLVTNSSKIICHSLFFNLVDFIYLNKITKKCKSSLIWVIWGKDLYEDFERTKTIKGFILVKPIIKEYFRKSLIYKMEIFITTGDYDVLKERYRLNPNAKVFGAQYTYNLLKIIEKKENKKIHVMVGHSATETCRHLETFELLKKYVGKIKVFCPLSYPDNRTTYIDKIIKKGKEIFNDDFVPLTKFMNYEEYVTFLNSIDIGIFNNNRQQGMGNITNLLYLGKKVYLSKDNTVRKSYHVPEYYIFDCEEIQNEDFLTLLSEEMAINNTNRIIYKFSDDNFFKEWSRIFNE